MANVLPLPLRSRALAAATVAAVLMGSAPSHAQEVRQVLDGPEASGERIAPTAPSEVERFCSNIADAARDRRYAIQAEELRKLQADVDQRLAALEEKRSEYETWLKRREVFLARAEENLVQIYSRMKPDAAAERLSALNVELASAILMKLDARKSSVILNEMESKSAAELTRVMASATRREDPS